MLPAVLAHPVSPAARGGEAIPPGVMEWFEGPNTSRSRALNSHGFPSLPMGQPDPERAQLDALCRQRGLSRAEALRQALRLWLK
ncbi:MAG: ribbon-helix-helix domain-containing protein, partial [Cyanobacteriota bacterium]|nr:ribbon-helix-helix domain-containing protein [Cyanobacteriota bacterium]